MLIVDEINLLSPLTSGNFFGVLLSLNVSAFENIF